MKDFTFPVYAMFLKELISIGIPILTVEEFLRSQTTTKNVILRHDVDRRVSKSLHLAELENSLGVKASYYFRVGKSGFPQEAIRRIAGLGHRVGYHYEDLSRNRGNFQQALNDFSRNLDLFRTTASCETVCRHGSPLSRYDSIELMRQETPESFGLLGDAVLSMEPCRVVYFTDTGGSWSMDSTFNLRDNQPGALSEGQPNNTWELLTQVLDSNSSYYLNTHPERWGLDRADYLYCRAFDHLVNVIKLGLKRARNAVD